MLQETVVALWQLAPVRIAARLVNAGLNLVGARDLTVALVRADLLLIVIAIAWLIPWGRLVVLAWRAAPVDLRRVVANRGRPGGDAPQPGRRGP
ncbi:hypothetical protein [Spirillospora sp. CA-294931]|uniref:hypothetical protein n=1 Tax=Spirillospora sp. CA-294931 TaxID=3240042 RepID=UPI003D909734